MKKRARFLPLFLSLVLALGVCGVPAAAKTTSAPKADNVFFYAKNAEGKSVLLRVMSLEELKKLSHSQANGSNYFTSTTDNYPTTQYCEGRGFTIPELLDYVKRTTPTNGAAALSFSGGDTLRMMATDSYGNYSRSWTYDQLYGVKRYYFEGLYQNWKTSWEVGGEDTSKFGMTLEEYNASYKDSDPHYQEKRTVFEGGVETIPVLMTESFSGRTTSETLASSSEPGITAYLKANGGTAAGCLKDVLADTYALHFSLPMTEADLMSAHRTAYDNFKWIYNLRLDMSQAPNLSSRGTVAEAVPTFQRNGDTLTITFRCATSGASIYYGYDGSAQTLYTGPITLDVSGRDLNTNPVTIYAAAVKEGWDDAGSVSFSYPGGAPSFQTVYTGMTGSSLTFTAASTVSSADWTAWTGALSFVTMKSPGVNGYKTLDKSKYKIDNIAKTIVFDSSLFTDSGSYSFIFHAAKFANKSVSVAMKKAAPALSAPQSVPFGTPLTIQFDDANYQTALSVYLVSENGGRTMISASYLDRTAPGQLTIRAGYFTAPSTAMGQPGRYTLELVNSQYAPASQTVEVTVSAKFSDVPDGAWFVSYVNDLANAGIVNGIGNNKFAPNGTLTWGEAMKLLMRTTGYEEQSPTGSHWASGYMDKAVADGLIAAGTDPSLVLSRLAFCQTAAKALKLEPSAAASPFANCADPYVVALNELGIINGTGGGRFAPDQTLTRAEISKIIWCILHLEEEA